MDPLLWNKVFAAILGAAFVILGLSFLSDAIFTSHAPEKAGFAIEVEESSSDHAKVDAKPKGVESVNAMLASADIGAGQKVAKKCAACHTFDKGGKNKVGPALFNIVNRPLASVDGFGYSAALKAYSDGKTWSYDELNTFLFKPKAHIKGTSMGFAGLKKIGDRAAVIAYLRSLADTPAAMPSE